VRGRREEHQSELRAFTEEQYVALDSMRLNDRVVFQGPAGTGKTLLAIEAARRDRAEGDRVLLLCFNRLLGKWLKEETSDLADAVVATTLHKLMLDLAQVEVPNGANSGFWTQELPEAATAALVDGAEPPEFSVLVTDEAQDILRDTYLDFLDLLLEGGLAAGRWMFFGDFERQALYDAADVSLGNLLEARASAPVYSLRINCRNTPRIATYVCLLGGLSPAYSGIRRPDEGPPPRTRYYAEPEEEVSELCDLLDELYRDGYRGDDIVMLSPLSSGSAARRIVQQPWGDRLRPFGEDDQPGYVRYSTIHAFKGLEAPVVILTDIDAVQGDRAQSLFYVGLTRATDRLWILADETTADEVLDLVARAGEDEIRD
jgi:hypothetical protein